MRTELRARRREQEPRRALEAARTVAARTRRLWPVARAHRLACYWAVGGEISCAPLIADALRRGQRVYLPVVTGGVLMFAPYDPDGTMVPNRFGIPEPSCHPSRLLPARAMHAIVAPLVAFDTNGSRLGMGGGYYDKTLYFMRSRPCFGRPHFIGVAYDFQRVERLPSAAWDVCLHAVVSEKAVYRFPSSPLATR